MNALRGAALAVLAAASVVACGGGGGETITSEGGSSTSTAANVLSISVNCGVLGCGQNEYTNGAFATVTVCVPGTSTCQSIDNILVDTGSEGLRLISSALNISLPAQTNGTSTIGECGVFADSYTWGPVATADIHLSGETASSVPIQVIGASDFPSAPTACSDQTTGQEEDTVNAFGANGILGVGVFGPDCGQECDNPVDDPANPNPGIYFACDSSSCAVTTETTADQVQNPVPLFAANNGVFDNNGVIVEMPSIPADGQASVTGSLVFGIGTESNNTLGSAQVLTLDGSGNFTTSSSFDGTIPGFLDTGSDALFFDDNAIAQCSGESAGFYCPSSTVNLAAQIYGFTGSPISVSFSVANADDFSESDTAFNDLAGTAGTGLTGYFDWGMPFFYGRNVYFAIQGQTAPNGTTPYNAFTSNSNIE